MWQEGPGKTEWRQWSEGEEGVRVPVTPGMAASGYDDRMWEVRKGKAPGMTCAVEKGVPLPRLRISSGYGG